MDLLDQVDMDTALGLAGPDGTEFPVSGAMVTLGSSSTVIIADPGDDPAASGVWNDQEFCLVGPAPAPVVSRLTGPMPFTTAGTPLPQQLVHLFVRLDGSCLYLGTGQVSMCETREDELIRCHLRISQPLSREILDRVRPPAIPPPLPAVAWLDYVHTNPGQALERFLTSWYPATSTQAPAADMPGSVPRALADFHRLAAQRPAILGSHNRIEPISEVRTDSRAERLIFAVECQGCWTWSIPWEPDAADTDPTVWFEESHPVPEHEPLSRFLLQFSLWEAAQGAVYQASCHELPRKYLPALERCLQRVPLRPFLLAPDAPTHFFVASGLVAAVVPSLSDGKVDIEIGTQFRSTLQQLNQLSILWRHFDG
ncbi:hypothetical protein ACWEQ7_36495 [Streptomyces sp. NPDC004069]